MHAGVHADRDADHRRHDGGGFHGVPAFRARITGQGEGDQRVAHRRAQRAVTAGGDHDELLRPGRAGRSSASPDRRPAARRSRAPPGLDVEGAHRESQRRADEDEAAGGDQRAAEVRASPSRAPPARPPSRGRAERDLPADIAGREIDGGQRAPGRRIARHAERRQQRLAIHPVGRASCGANSRPAARRGALRARSCSRGTSVHHERERVRGGRSAARAPDRATRCPSSRRRRARERRACPRGSAA